ncbi:LOW QUALITY PROTEIN: kinesin-like protein KIF13B [Cololabis saira]|uniref:LOW QUALITY PROTEIN: kinesin-like protein KIF13B n=1 Tax=Cololabis saira TaxID=129043 RepID=UPI002AD2C5E6|nr:LOW QUALITY PROTEIN: kinesin-like protein KIF13B [Cololabis saira]
MEDGFSPQSDSNVKVAVRVRPMNRREKDLKTKCVVEMDGNQTVLHPAATHLSKGDPRNQPKVFAYDYCFWSMDESQQDKFAGQDVVFQCLGESLLDNAFMGYNACIFAYGQTGSGKSYTMMGSAEQPGLIPRLCSSLFSRTVQEAFEGETFAVEVSFMEIYNEKVRDLLDPKGSRQALRVREHKVLGPYVDGLSRLAVASYKDIESLMSEGNKSRTVAATNMNEESSRSHAVFNIILTHTLLDLQSGTSGEKVSKLSLVDLAGSERAAKTGAAGERLKEGSNINKSLSTLGLVISALADQGVGKNRSKFVPYRDSVLTWLLKDSLGGNSRTAMVATISPAADNYDETLSTLRYADRAKSIVNHAVVNEDPNARIIRELREEVEKLREQLTEAESMKAPELKERLEESEKLIQEMTVTWEDKLRKTEAVAQERQKQLESLGISLQSSGIRVVDDKCFLVNLNADPALNELLVYYLKEHTRVGSADSQDIQLCGMAIQAEHCVIDVADDSGVVLTPHRSARTCVNGAAVTSPVPLHHGDRILWGNNHFFRINLPRHLVHAGVEDEDGGAAMRTYVSSDQLEVDLDASSDVSSELSFGYEFAQAEVMMKGMGTNDPLQAVLQTLERQHEEEKRCALERQRLMYETELQQLRRRLGPEQAGAAGSPGVPKRVRRWSEDREAMMTRGLRRLREQIMRAKLLAEEASFIAEELHKRTEYLVTLQIPAANLDANRKRDVVLSEPAIQVRRKGKGKQIWALEKMENRLVDMRELYQEWKDFDEDNPAMRSHFKHTDPFFDEQENHSLIGVANVFLACLFHDVKLQYAVPIINQKGEVAGRLHVELWRGTESSEDDASGRPDAQLSSTDEDAQEKKLDCVVKILQATGLPRHLSNFVFCNYHFWGQEDPLFTAPEVAPTSSSSASKDPQCTVVFDSPKEFSVPVSEDLVEFLADGSIAIEVYGHKQANHRRNLALWDLGVIQAKTRSLRERWSEVTRRLELWVQVMELSEAGDFAPVEVLPARDVRTGGVFQLRQGQSRHLRVEVRAVPDSGTMPLIAASVQSVSIGDVKVRQTSRSRPDPAPDEDMDSYQEVELERMKDKCLRTLAERQEYLDQQLQKVVSKPDKSEDDVERESQLLEGRLTLTEERNAVLVPSAGSGIPGAPAQRVPVPGMETHIPVLFLDLSADDFQSSPVLAGGYDAVLSEEDEDEFFELQVVRHYDSEVKVEASWDSTVHECPQLSRSTPSDQRVYLTVRAAVQLSHPAEMQLMLRKRICVNVTGKQGFAQSLLKRMSQRSPIPGCGVTFEVVSNIPGDIHGPEDREMLARLAASAEDDQSADSMEVIEKYLRSVLAVENLLTLDRLRQEVAVREQLAVRGKPARCSLSTPNISRLSASSMDLYSSLHRLGDIKGWESHQDLSGVPPPPRRTLPSSTSSTCSTCTSQNLNLDPGVASHPPPAASVPRLLKSLLPGGRDEGLEEEAARRQSLPRIVVQSASVEDGLVKHQQPVPIEEIIPADLEFSAPLPPPVTVETEDVTPSPVSDVSSGYMSTSVSTVTLSDVYTLSWDLPPSCSAGAVPDEEEEPSSPGQSEAPEPSPPGQSEAPEPSPPGQSEAPEPSPPGQSEAPEPVPGQSEAPEPSPPGQSEAPEPSPPGQSEAPEPSPPGQSEAPEPSPPGQSEAPEPSPPGQSEAPEPSPPGQSEAPEPVPGQSEAPEPSPPGQSEAPEPSPGSNEVTADDTGSDPTHPTSVQVKEGEEPEPETLLASDQLNSSEPEPETKPGKPAQTCDSKPDGPIKEVLERQQDPAVPDSTGDPAPDLIPALPEASPSGPEPNTDSSPGSSPQEKPSPAPPGVRATQDPAPNPFRIQKVKSSDLKSFQQIVGEETGQDRAGTGSPGAGLNLPVPAENLEIISDCEDGDAAAVLPDWLKVGELVTVGTNKTGLVRFVGATAFADGTWVGVELEVPAGKNDGSVGGKHYFHCNPGYGVLVRPRPGDPGRGEAPAPAAAEAPQRQPVRLQPQPGGADGSGQGGGGAGRPEPGGRTASPGTLERTADPAGGARARRHPREAPTGALKHWNC